MNKSEICSRGLKWTAALLLAVVAAGCGGGGKDPVLGGVDAFAALPMVTFIFPNASALPPSTACTTQVVYATFNEPMNKATVEALNTFTLQPSGPPLGASIGGTVSYDIAARVATFMPTAPLPIGNYTATITSAAKNLAGNPLVLKTWTFDVAGGVCAAPPVATNILLSAVRYGTFGGTAGMTNEGIQTLITGAGGATADIGTIATGTSSITGFQDSALPVPDVYTVVPGVNQGIVTGKIFTCTTSVTGPTNPTNGVNAVSCAKATQARLDAQAAYTALSLLPDSSILSTNDLSGRTLAPGVYKAAGGGSFLITGTDLTLDAQGDANAVWVFQMTALTVGASAAPRTINLTNGALAKNVYWQVASTATINPGGGGTMVGTIIAQQGVVFSTSGSVINVNLNGRAISLIASVTMVNTVITVPAP